MKLKTSNNRDIEITMVDVNSVYPNDWNPKDDFNTDEELKEQYENIKKSIKRHGFNDPIDVREKDSKKGKYEICDGQHRWLAAKELGLKTVLILNHGKLDDNEAKAITSIREMIKIPVNEAKFSEMLFDIYEDNGENIQALVDTLIMSEEQIKEYLALKDFSWDQYSASFEQDKNLAENMEGLEISTGTLGSGINTVHEIKFAITEKDFNHLLLLKQKDKKGLESLFRNFISEVGQHGKAKPD